MELMMIGSENVFPVGTGVHCPRAPTIEHRERAKAKQPTSQPFLLGKKFEKYRKKGRALQMGKSVARSAWTADRMESVLIVVEC